MKGPSYISKQTFQEVWEDISECNNRGMLIFDPETATMKCLEKNVSKLLLSRTRTWHRKR